MSRASAIVSIPSNLVARDFIATGLVQRIADTGLHVVLCCHARDKLAVDHLSSDLDVTVATYAEAGDKFDSAHALLADVRFSLQGTVSGHMAQVRERIASSVVLRSWLRFCRASPNAAEAILARMERILSARAAQRSGPLLDTYGARVVVTPGPGFRAEDRSLLRAARSRGAPAVSVVSSWDNLTARGAVKAPVDVLAVWNEPMRRHAVQFHHLPSDSVEVTGVPAFDAYVDVERQVSRAENAVHLRLPCGETRYVTFLTGMLVSAAECADIRELLDGLERLHPHGDAPWLVIRVHPNEDPAHYREFRDRPRTVINFEGLEITEPAQRLGASPRAPVMTRDAHIRKGAMLAYSEIVVASLCTTALVEASLFDRPVLAIERERPGVDQAVQTLIASLDSYTHQVDFRNSGALEVASSMPAAMISIRKLLADPSLRREERRRATSLLCGPLDGRSAHRVAALIHRSARRRD